MYAAKNQPFSIYYTRVFHPVKTVVVTGLIIPDNTAPRKRAFLRTPEKRKTTKKARKYVLFSWWSVGDSFSRGVTALGQGRL